MTHPTNHKQMVETRITMLNDAESAYPFRGLYRLEQRATYPCITVQLEDGSTYRIASGNNYKEILMWLEGYMVAHYIPVHLRHLCNTVSA